MPQCPIAGDANVCHGVWCHSTFSAYVQHASKDVSLITVLFQRLLRDELLWFNVTVRVRFKLTVLVYRSLYGMTPRLHTHVAGRQGLWSASQRTFIVPRYRLISFGRRCLLLWARRPGIRYQTVFVSLNMFRRQLKTNFFAKY